MHGDCVAPEVCRCHFSFVGPGCDTACKCNMHSQCPGLHKLDVCVECRNNTAGEACGECEAGFVGDPRDGGDCESCRKYCNGMTEDCFGKRRLRDEGLLRPDDFADDRDVRVATPSAKLLRQLRKTGLHPERDEPVCVNCGGHTVGLRCERCEAGYFSMEDGECVRCQCNGHGDVCDRLTGEDCLCKNNTVSDLKPCHHANKPLCYEFQCNQCKGWLFKIISTSIEGWIVSGHHRIRDSSDIVEEGINAPVFAQPYGRVNK